MQQLSGYVLLASAAAVCARWAKAWSVLAPLLLLCLTVVLVAWVANACPRTLSRAAVGAVLLLKLAVLGAGYRTLRPAAVGVAPFAAAVGIAAVYISLADVPSVYDCAVDPSRVYLPTVLVSLVAYAGLWGC